MRKMKDSGVAWIGDIPEDWDVIRFKDKWVNKKEIAKEKSVEYERLALTLNGVIKRAKTDAEGLQPKAFDDYQILENNNFIFKMIDLQNISTSRVGLSPYTGLVSPAYIRFIPKKDGQFSKFTYYFLMSMYYNCVYNNLAGDGVRSALNASDMGAFNIPWTSDTEQEAIASYLDRKTSQIDALIGNVRGQIEKLKAYKQSLITEVVTKGLNPSAPMKDSGVEWIGQIPEKWEVYKMKVLFKNVSVKNKGGERVLSLYRDYGVLPKDSRDDNHNVTSLDTDSYKYVEKGNLVINKMKAWSGSLAMSDYTGIISPAYYVCRVSIDGLAQRFIHHYLRNQKIVQVYEQLSAGMRIGQWDLGIDDFLKIEVAIPPLSEQEAIAAYLDTTCGQIDRLVEVKEAKIANLEQYKKSLIYEVVTGKREVV